jgi:chromosome segregation ATPase
MAVYTIIIAAVASGAVVWNWRSVEDAVRPWKQAFTRVDKEKDKAELQLQKSERARAQLEEERRELRRQVDSLHELIRVDRQARIRVDEETPQEVSPTERVPLKYQPSRHTDSFGELPK